ncbi:MAG: MoxR family ATPase, partial [Planktothrix agardhii KL2]|nr:MoxR family ATPase [Planktothrix agardhii KL2]
MNQPLEYTGDQEYQPQPEPNQRGKKLCPYRPEAGLIQAVNLAIALERPLLLEGEPGCGKTQLAFAIAYEFSKRYLEETKEWPYFPWNIKSTTRAQDGL